MGRTTRYWHHAAGEDAAHVCPVSYPIGLLHIRVERRDGVRVRRGWESLGSNSYSFAIDGIGGTKPMERTGLTCDQYGCAHLAHTPRHIFYKLGKGPGREGGRGNRLEVHVDSSSCCVTAVSTMLTRF
jgi:hypothetical protein